MLAAHEQGTRAQPLLACTVMSETNEREGDRSVDQPVSLSIMGQCEQSKHIGTRVHLRILYLIVQAMTFEGRPHRSMLTNNSLPNEPASHSPI